MANGIHNSLLFATETYATLHRCQTFMDSQNKETTVNFRGEQTMQVVTIEVAKAR